MPYITHNVHLTKKQQYKLAHAIKTLSPVSIKLSHAHISGNVPLLLTQRQINRLSKAHSLGKGSILKLSNAQIHHMTHTGGFLPALMAALPAIGTFLLETALPALATGALGGLASYGVNKIANAAEGKGIHRNMRDRKTISNILNHKHIIPYSKYRGNGLYPLGLPR
jgi:hypothetical protein